MINSDLFRQTMRQWAAGVTVITVADGGKVHGMTANSFTSVSCDPPLVLFCVGRSNDTHKIVKVGSTVGINLLCESQMDISVRFAMKTGARYKFDDLDSFASPKSATLFHGCAAVMEATVSVAYEAGDHTIFIAEVLWADTDGMRKPLVYSQGGYAQLRPIPTEASQKTIGKPGARKKSGGKAAPRQKSARDATRSRTARTGMASKRLATASASGQEAQG